MSTTESLNSGQQRVTLLKVFTHNRTPGTKLYFIPCIHEYILKCNGGVQEQQHVNDNIAAFTTRIDVQEPNSKK